MTDDVDKPPEPPTLREQAAAATGPTPSPGGIAAMQRANDAKAAKGRVPEKIVCKGAECLKINPHGLIKNRQKFGADSRTATKRRKWCLVCERADVNGRRGAKGGRGGKAAALTAPEAEKPNLPVISESAGMSRVFEEMIRDHEALITGAVKPDVFAAIVAQRREIYGISGMDAIYDIAMIPNSDNSMLMQVKLLAAKALVALRGDDGSGKATPLDDMLAAMNDEFHKNAPKIRAVRETTREIVLESGDAKLVN